MAGDGFFCCNLLKAARKLGEYPFDTGASDSFRFIVFASSNYKTTQFTTFTRLCQCSGLVMRSRLNDLVSFAFNSCTLHVALLKKKNKMKRKLSDNSQDDENN